MLLLIMNKKPEDKLPEQEEGAQTNTEASKEFKDVEGAQDNEAVAIGAITGFAKLQWKSLVSGLVEDK
ncbi:MAG: hypothetical protein M3413_13505 [Bacteroidota bacterium]|nr:hypothetical protein [Bacteroidota bacterium]